MITQIGDAHLAGFGDRRNIASAKAELLAALPPDGQAVLADNFWLRSAAEECPARITWIGTGGQCDLRAVDVQSVGGRLSFRIVLKGTGPEQASAAAGSDEDWIDALGAERFASACRSGDAIMSSRRWPPRRSAGCSASASAEMADALAEYRPMPMRCEVIRNAGSDDHQRLLQLESHGDAGGAGAAPRVRRRRDAASSFAATWANWASNRWRSHWQLGKQIVEIGGADMLVACGRFARHVVAGALAAGMARGRAIACPTVDESPAHLGQAMLPGDVVLVKGSRMMAMERIVAALEECPRRRSA